MQIIVSLVRRVMGALHYTTPSTLYEFSLSYHFRMKVRVSVQDLSGHHPVMTSARPAPENMGIELGAIPLYATGLTLLSG